MSFRTILRFYKGLVMCINRIIVRKLCFKFFEGITVDMQLNLAHCAAHFFVGNLRSMTLSTFPHSQREVVLDWQGLQWSLTQAYPTPYGFEVYKGYAG
jgi:hypothetical protein